MNKQGSQVKNIIEAQIKAAFSIFDQSGEDTIPYSYLGTLLRSLGYDINEQSALGEAQLIDIKQNGSISFQQFKNYHYRKLKQFDVQFKQAFDAMDIDKDKYISFNDLKIFLESSGIKKSDQEINQMINDADIDGDGYINYQEFVRLMATR